MEYIMAEKKKASQPSMNAEQMVENTTLPVYPDFTIDRLGPSKYPSPLLEYMDSKLSNYSFIRDDEKILVDPCMDTIRRFCKLNLDPPAMERAGPRKKIFFNPSEIRAAIVTCGGLCPGLNDVIRSIFMQLNYRYKVKEVLGIRYGFSGLAPRIGRPPVKLTTGMVETIHREGGSFLGSSRGPQDPSEMVDFLEREMINILFVIGGDGSQRGALALSEEIERRGDEISIIGIPKTIDNDISYVARSFGFQTAVSVARDVLSTGHNEARGAYNGVAVVKLMGRNSGFIAAMAAVANGDANYVLVPEVPFDMEGPNGFLQALEKRLEERKHALVVVAEGAGQDIISRDESVVRDPSGNVKLKDIGIFLRDSITRHFSTGWTAASVKYIDPSYIIRSSPANADDSIFCTLLAQNAVHAAMSGRTRMVISRWNNFFTHVPMQAVISARKKIDPTGPEWLSVLESTGQPASMKN